MWQSLVFYYILVIIQTATKSGSSKEFLNILSLCLAIYILSTRYRHDLLSLAEFLSLHLLDILLFTLPHSVQPQIDY